MSRTRTRTRKNSTRRFRQLLLGCQMLEDRRLMAVTNPDLIQFAGAPLDSIPDDTLSVELRTPQSVSSNASFPRYIELLSNTAGDQSVLSRFVGAEQGSRLAESIALSATSTYVIDVDLQSQTNLGELPIIIDQFDDQRTLLASSSLVLRPVVSTNSTNSTTEQTATRYRGLIGVNSSGLPWDRLALLPSATKVEVRSMNAESPNAWVTIGFLDDAISNGLATAEWNGSALFTSQHSDNLRQSDEAFYVDTTKPYQFSVQIDRLDLNSLAQSHSIGFIAQDADGKEIDSVHVVRYATAVDTRLAAPLNPGDTFIDLVDATVGAIPLPIQEPEPWPGTVTKMVEAKSTTTTPIHVIPLAI